MKIKHMNSDLLENKFFKKFIITYLKLHHPNFLCKMMHNEVFQVILNSIYLHTILDFIKINSVGIHNELFDNIIKIINVNKLKKFLPTESVYIYPLTNVNELNDYCCKNGIVWNSNLLINSKNRKHVFENGDNYILIDNFDGKAIYGDNFLRKNKCNQEEFYKKWDENVKKFNDNFKTCLINFKE